MAAGVTNAAPIGGGLKVIASGKNSYGDTFDQPAKFIILTSVSSTSLITTCMLLPGDTTSEEQGRYDDWVSFASNGMSFSSDAGVGTEAKPYNYVALG